MDKISTDSPTQLSVTFLVVGGGIAGVTCAETLCTCCPEESVVLLTESNVVKTVTNLHPIARYLQKFDVEEMVTEDAKQMHPGIHYIVDAMQHISVKERKVFTSGHRCISYQYLCICTGARPHLIDNSKYIIGIRDTDSVITMQERLTSAETILLVGNGGIASELAHELKNVTVHWVIKDKHIASTFLDAAAANFIQKTLTEKQQDDHDSGDGQQNEKCFVKRLRYEEITLHGNDASSKSGAALGPDWHRKYELSGCLNTIETHGPIMHYQDQIKSIDCNSSNDRKARVVLNSGIEIICDFVVSATGVDPYINYTSDEALKLSTADGGILVDEMMATNLPSIYAAGDVCTAGWERAEHWFQMRLWTQARQMGSMAGRSMAAAHRHQKIYQDFCFELFGHVTQLFGYPVVLLGRYNGQELGNGFELLIRSTPNKEYIKFVLKDGRLRGALLIGNTDLAETCENLILNAIDLTPYGDDILNPDIDIEDYFD